MTPDTPTEHDVPADSPEFVRREDVEQMIRDRLRERDEEHAREIAEVRATMPQLTVAPNSGGPGSDNHQTSWSLAEQELAARGETLDTWS